MPTAENNIKLKKENKPPREIQFVPQSFGMIPAPLWSNIAENPITSII